MIKNDMVILFLGDSITAAKGYVDLLEARIMFENPDKNLTVHNKGVSGNRIVDLFARLKEDCHNIKPDIVTILIGINDIWKEYKNNEGVEAEKFWRMYDMVLGEIAGRAPDAKIVMMEPFALGGGLPVGDYGAWREELAIRSSVIKNLSEEYSAMYIPLQELFDKACHIAPDTYWLHDGIHPTSAGHGLIADAWAARLLV